MNEALLGVIILVLFGLGFSTTIRNIWDDYENKKN